MNVAKLNIDPETIRGTKLGDNHAEPVQDANGNWVVSLHEATFLPLSDFEVIEWVAPETENETI